VFHHIHIPIGQFVGLGKETNIKNNYFNGLNDT